MTGWEERGEGPLRWWIPQPWSAWPDLVAVCSTRRGGFSQGPYAQLNVGWVPGDDPGNVVANRRLLVEALALPPGTVFAAVQVHGSRTAVAPFPALPARQWPERVVTYLGEADVLVAPGPGVFLFATFADCVPVLLVEPRRRAAALAHAGWRGTAARAAAEAVRALCAAAGCSPADVQAALGPAIGACCYRVGQEVAEAVAAVLPHPREAVRPLPGGWAMLDLVEANRQQLVEAGVPPQSIAVAGACTACRSHEFYSHRAAGGRTGRFAAVVGWRK